MDSLEDVLKQSIVFNSVADGDLDRIMPLFIKWELHTGDILATARDSAQFFFLLAEGTLLMAMDEGRAVVLDMPGDFGAMELLSRDGIYTTTVTALENGLAWAIPRTDFLGFIQEDTPGAAGVMAGWQQFLDTRAMFAKQITKIDVPVMS
ncbi:MAG: cyclic nucleotide-binding domain-containing protein [Desulfobacter sp.]|nr:cyclic nucleotide-binding domain-containing protein [Desulfobacter sp.]WDP85371.1 MAG: cyclic nucleotide-binding domain-containing protein [Desulfobacter sp.]